MSLRKQIEMKESKDKLTIEEENRMREAERQARIANRATNSQDLNQMEPSEDNDIDQSGIISRSRRAANIRSGSIQGR